MNAGKLTNRAFLSHKVSMRKAGTVLMAMLGSATVAGCISVNAPDKPIVIELNVNIRQEVIYRLAADAEKTINENEDIF